MNALIEISQEFWDILTGVVDDNKSKLVRLSCFTVLFLGMLWAAVNYFRADRISDTSVDFSSSYRETPRENRDALNKFEALAQTVSNMRHGGEDIAKTIAAMNSRPFNIEGYNDLGLENLGADRDITRFDALAAMSGTSADLAQQQDPIAPVITLKAVMLSKNSQSAVIDIGDKKGYVIRKGEKLPDDLGRVIKIRPNGITVRADKHDFDYEVSKIEVIKSMR